MDEDRTPLSMRITDGLYPPYFQRPTVTSQRDADLGEDLDAQLAGLVLIEDPLRRVGAHLHRRLSHAGDLVPILLKGGTANEEFLQAYIGKNDTAYRAGWRSLVFSGQATMPKSLEGDAAVVEFVAHNPGAVGYIGKASPHEGVKVLAVK